MGNDAVSNQNFPQKTQRKKEHPEFIDSLGAFAPLREHILSNCTSTLAILKPLR